MNSSWMDVFELTRVVGGSLVQEGPRVPLVGVTTDSRAVKPGQIFVALEGERFDGHAFVADVVRKGAAVVLVSLCRADAVVAATGPACSVIGVEDTLVALGAPDPRRTKRTSLPHGWKAHHHALCKQLP